MNDRHSPVGTQCKTSRNKSTTTKKAQTTARAVCAFWSKWRDSNPRSPVPEAYKTNFLLDFRGFRGGVSETDAFRYPYKHCVHVVRTCRWSKMWSSYNHPRFRAEEFIQCHSQINLINRKYYTINSLKS